jgi:hypothetical protein
MNASLVQRAGIAGLAAALCLLTGSAANAGAAAPYVWTEIVLPSSSVANAFGPNDRGQVAVTAVDGTSGIYRNGTFTQLPAPPAGYQVSATGINNAGVIVGVASTTTDTHEQGFILVSGVYTFFSRPGWGNTEPRAIGNSGLVTGYSFQDTGETAGFVYDPATGVFTDVTPRLSTFTIAQGINKFGRISGNGREAVLGRFGFIWQQGTFTNGPRQLLPFLDRFIVDAGSTNARGINDAGIIVGYISGATSAGFIGPIPEVTGCCSRPALMSRESQSFARASTMPARSSAWSATRQETATASSVQCAGTSTTGTSTIGTSTNSSGCEFAS